MNVILVFLYIFSIVKGQLFESEEDSRILIIGDHMRGRMDLGSVLLGRDASGRIKHDKCFASDFHTCIDKGSWLGKETIDITIIDAPAFPFKMKDQQRMINDLVNTLRKEIRFTNIFIITFDQWAINMSYSSRMILSSLYRIFGDKIWEHAILLAPDWRYSSYEERVRDFTNLTEENWALTLNKELQHEFKAQIELPSVFLDSTEGKKTKSEIKKFENQAQQLLNFVQSKSNKFVFKDIEMALSDIATLNKRIDILIHSNEERHFKINDLNEQIGESENIDYIALVIFAGSIILVAIILLITVCIRWFKINTQEYDSEGAQSSKSSNSSELEVQTLVECLSSCGYSTEEIGRVQRIISGSQNL